MANSKYYTSKMHSHLKAFFLKNFEHLDFEFSDIYNKQYPKRYQSAIHNDKSLFYFIGYIASVSETSFLYVIPVTIEDE